MKILLQRAANVNRGERMYCIGHLFVDGKFFCDTIEDYDRGLDSAMKLEQLERMKVYGKTAIPVGTYKVDMKTISNAYCRKAFYVDFCNARMPRLVDVPAYSGVLIHPGNTEEDSYGCILVGENKEVGKVINSRRTWANLYNVLKGEEDIEITIERKY